MNFFLKAHLIFALSGLLLTSCGDRSPEPQTQPSNAVITMDQPLMKFDQELTTAQKELVLKPGQTITIPITIRNTTGVVLSSSGRYPIDLSYKWFDGTKMLPIEGDRTGLSRPLEPNGQTTVNAQLTAPQSGSDLSVHFTLVQEGIAWFMGKGARSLDIPARLQP
jgi:hypothetical protein